MSKDKKYYGNLAKITGYKKTCSQPRLYSSSIPGGFKFDIGLSGKNLRS